MATHASVPLPGGDPASLPPAKARIVAAAASLFAEHGVGGTSLQMIADSVGVTKAAIYHQFKAKSAIIIATADAEVALLEEAVRAAEKRVDAEASREAVLSSIIDLAIARRHMENSLVGDPVLVRFFAHHKPFLGVMERLYRVLAGGRTGPEARMQAAIVTAAMGGAVMHPLVASLDDATLRSQLMLLVQRVLDPQIASGTTDEGEAVVAVGD